MQCHKVAGVSLRQVGVCHRLLGPRPAYKGRGVPLSRSYFHPPAVGRRLVDRHNTLRSDATTASTDLENELLHVLQWKRLLTKNVFLITI